GNTIPGRPMRQRRAVDARPLGWVPAPRIGSPAGSPHPCRSDARLPRVAGHTPLRRKKREGFDIPFIVGARPVHFATTVPSRRTTMFRLLHGRPDFRTSRRSLRGRNRRAFGGLGPLVERLEGRTLLSISIDDVTVIEGDSGTVDAVFTVRLSASSTQTVTVQ